MLRNRSSYPDNSWTSGSAGITTLQSMVRILRQKVMLWRILRRDLIRIQTNGPLAPPLQYPLVR